MASKEDSVRVIASMNQKGGVGKTTSTVNLGAALAELGAQVLLIDLDPQAHLTLHVGVNPEDLEYTVYDLLVDDEIKPSDVIRPVSKGLSVLGAEVDLAAAEQELVNHPNRQRILRDKLASVEDMFDFILIDCPPSLGLLTINGLVMAREVIVPMQAHFLALQGVSKLLETVQMVGAEMNPELTVTGVLLCMHDAQTNLAGEVVEDLETFFTDSRAKDFPWRDAQVFYPAVRRNIKLAECPSFGQTIFQYAPTCPGAQDYRDLATMLVGGASAQSFEKRRNARRKKMQEAAAKAAAENADDHNTSDTSESPAASQDDPNQGGDDS